MCRKRYRQNKNAIGNQVSAYMRFVVYLFTEILLIFLLLLKIACNSNNIIFIPKYNQVSSELKNKVTFLKVSINGSS